MSEMWIYLLAMGDMSRLYAYTFAAMVLLAVAVGLLEEQPLWGLLGVACLLTLSVFLQWGGNIDQDLEVLVGMTGIMSVVVIVIGFAANHIEWLFKRV